MSDAVINGAGEFRLEVELPMRSETHGSNVPVFRVRANQPEELKQLLISIAEGGAYAAAGEAVNSLMAQGNMGAILGARGESPAPPVEQQQQQAEAPQVQQQAPTAGQQFMNAAPPQQQWQPQQPPAAAPPAQPVQQAQQQTVGGIAPGSEAPAPPPTQGGMFTPHGGGTVGMPGAPAVLQPGGVYLPATFATGQSDNGRNWAAFRDPRPYDEVKHLTETKDPNDPGLAAGTHRFNAWL